MKKLIAVAILSSNLLSGCVTTDVGAYIKGTEVTKDQMEMLTLNYANKNDVISRIGEPERKQEHMGSELFYYDFTKIRHLGSNVSESTVFEFDKSGLLINKYKTKNTQKTGNAIFDSMIR